MRVVSQSIRVRAPCGVQPELLLRETRLTILKEGRPAQADAPQFLNPNACPFSKTIRAALVGYLALRSLGVGYPYRPA